MVDNDLRFAFWLAKILDAAGYQALPAHDVHAAFVLLRDVSDLEATIRIIVIGRALEAADLLVRHCRERSPRLSVVWLRDSGDPVPNVAQDITWIKPADPHSAECTDLLIAIGRLLAATPAPTP